MKYHIGASVDSSDATTASLQGYFYLLENRPIVIGHQVSDRLIQLGIRGFSATNEIMLDGRGSLEQKVLRPDIAVGFVFELDLAALLLCTQVQIALVQEGSHWISGSEADTHFEIGEDEPSGKPLLRPFRHYATDFFDSHECGKASFAFAYLQRLYDAYGYSVMADFAWSYFLGRKPNLKDRNDGLALIHSGAVSIASYGRGLYESLECRERIAIWPLSDPYRELGVWADNR